MTRLAVILPLLLSGCGTIQMQPADPNTTAAIVAACTADGVFVSFGGRLVLAAADPTRIVAPLVAAGVDMVCANPGRFSADISTAAWVFRNIGAVLGKR